MKLAEREAFLDGYRHGLGAGIRATQSVIDNLAELRHVNNDHRAVVHSVLVGLVSGLRQISASVVLADPNTPDDE